ncbi:MAG: MFS transporter [Hyphomonadaceae bacterium]|nr:MFS transporter [Hyphomonadaceae bacterium]
MAERFSARGEQAWRVGLLCLVVTMFEGFDLQIIGVLAPTIGREMALTPAALGGVFGAATLGLLGGAIISGFLADKVGRKPTLVASIGVFALCTWATSFAQTGDQLVLARFLTGLGLGGAMPSIAALSSEAVGRKNHIAFVTIMFAGMPFGGALSALAVALWPGEISWRSVFEIGGWAQLGLTLAILALMPESREFVDGKRAVRAAAANAPHEARVPAGAIRAPISYWIGVAGLCIAFFFTLLSLHFFLNWLPSMLSAQGFGGRNAAFVSCAFGMAGACGSVVVGAMAQGGRARLAMFAAYAGVAFVSALPWVFGRSFAGALALGALVGFCLVGGQMTLYGLAPGFFASRVRGLGVGVTIAAGRLGSFVGPTLAGALLALGWTQRDVMALNAPAALLAAGALAVAVSCSGKAAPGED